MAKHFNERGHRWAIYDGDTLLNLGFPWNLTPWNTSIYRTRAEAREALELLRTDLPNGSRVVKVAIQYVLE